MTLDLDGLVRCNLSPQVIFVRLIKAWYSRYSTRLPGVGADDTTTTTTTLGKLYPEASEMKPFSWVG